jgi:hypothetical protein
MVNGGKAFELRLERVGEGTPPRVPRRRRDDVIIPRTFAQRSRANARNTAAELSGSGSSVSRDAPTAATTLTKPATKGA